MMSNKITIIVRLRNYWRAIFFIFMANLSGCTQVSRTAQSVISIHSDNSQVRDEIRLLAASVSKEAGFLHMTQAGNSEFLAKNGQYQILYIDESNESFISINNILDKSCIKLSVYSSKGKDDSKKVIDKIKDKVIEKVKKELFHFDC